MRSVGRRWERYLQNRWILPGGSGTRLVLASSAGGQAVLHSMQ